MYLIDSLFKSKTSRVTATRIFVSISVLSLLWFNASAIPSVFADEHIPPPAEEQQEETPPVEDPVLEEEAQEESNEEGEEAPAEEGGDVSGEDGEEGESGGDAGDGDDATEGDEEGENGEEGESGDNGDDGIPEDEPQAGDGEGTDGEEGSGGEEGGEGDEEPAASEDDTVIETGDAAVGADVSNAVNVNNTRVCAEPSLEEIEEDSTETAEDSVEGEGATEATEEGSDSEESTEEPTTETLPEEGTDVVAESSEEAEAEAEGATHPGEPCTPLDTELNNDNDATLTNDLVVDGATGENNANFNEQNNVILDTGDSIAAANVLNIANLDVFDAIGLFVLLNNISNAMHELDIRNFDIFSEGSNWSGEDSTPCDGGCTAPDLTLTNNNVANLTNNVVVRSRSGENEASNNNGDVDLVTGNAYAAGNVVNVANTNIIDSNYLLVSGNFFGNWGGDIVLPAASFFESFFGRSAGIRGPASITNTNNATVNNTIGVDSSTGDNEALDNSGGSTIQTGDAFAGANIGNQLNQNLIGGGDFMVLIRVTGRMNANLFSPPPGILWQETPQGLVVYSDPNRGGSSEEVIGENVGGGTEVAGSNGGGGTAQIGSLNLNNTNDTTINNNLQITALTGANKVNGNGGRASIETGDAFAAANVFNMANTNIIGRNWMFMMFNILGDWNGNLAFGRPDLFIGAHAELSGRIGVDGHITYHFTVMNNGDADATNVRLNNLFDDRYLRFRDLDVHASLQENELVWNLGTVSSGETVEVSYSAAIENVPEGDTVITSTAEVVSDETDESMQDNEEVISLVAHRSVSGGSGGLGLSLTFPAKLELTKACYLSDAVDESDNAENDALDDSGEEINVSGDDEFGSEEVGDGVEQEYETILPGDSVDCTIVVTNTGNGPAYQALLIDILRDEEGNVINEQTWDLDQIYPQEEITVTYTTEFSELTLPGLYTNSAWIEGYSGYPARGFEISTDAMTSVIQVGESDLGVGGSGGENISAEVEVVESNVEVTDKTEKFSDPVPAAVIESPSHGSADGALLAAIYTTQRTHDYLRRTAPAPLTSSPSAFALVLGTLEGGYLSVLLAVALLVLLFAMHSSQPREEPQEGSHASHDSSDLLL